MAHGENAERHAGREYWSRRAKGHGAWDLSWGRVGKWITHKQERAEKRRVEHDAKKDATADDDPGSPATSPRA